MNSTIGVFEITIYMILTSLFIGVNMVYCRRYKNILKDRASGISVDSLLNDYSDEMVDIVREIITTQISDKSIYINEDSYRSDIVGKTLIVMREFLLKHTTLPKVIIGNIPDSVISTAILRVVDYIETVGEEPELDKSNIEEDDEYDPTIFELDNSETEDITDKMNNFYEE